MIEPYDYQTKTPFMQFGVGRKFRRSDLGALYADKLLQAGILEPIPAAEQPEAPSLLGRVGIGRAGKRVTK